MDHPFEIGKRYTDRHGRYEVLSLSDHKMRVRYEDGTEKTCYISAQLLARRTQQPGRDAPDAAPK